MEKKTKITGCRGHLSRKSKAKIATFLLTFYLAGSNAVPEAAQKFVHKDPQKCYGYVTANRGSDNDSFKMFRDREDLREGVVTHVVVNATATIDKDGRFQVESSGIPQNTITYLKDGLNKKVMLMVSNHQGGIRDKEITWYTSDDLLHKVLTEKAMDEVVGFEKPLGDMLIEDSIRCAQENQLDGLVFNVENADPKDRDQLTGIVSKWKQECDKKNLQFEVCIPAVTHDKTAYDVGKLSETCGVQFMIYDMNLPDAGPLAPVKIAEDTPNRSMKTDINDVIGYINQVVKSENKDKITCLFGAYGYPGGTNSKIKASAVPYKNIDKIITSKDAVCKWDDIAQAPFIEYDSKSLGHVKIYYEGPSKGNEDKDSLVIKIDKFEENNINNTGVWDLNHTNSEYMESIEKGMNRGMLDTFKLADKSDTTQIALDDSKEKSHKKSKSKNIISDIFGR